MKNCVRTLHHQISKKNYYLERNEDDYLELTRRELPEWMQVEPVTYLLRAPFFPASDRLQ